MRFLFLLAFMGGALFTHAARVDTVNVFSPSMHKTVRTVVITPSGYEKGKNYPVVYLLHGYSGNYADYIRNIPGIASDADTYGLIIVCPDGRYNSWYFDSPVDSSARYETFVSTELVQWVDGHYATVRDRSGRAIAGLSMGGHGALFLSFRHQDIFGAAGSMSGGVDLRPFPDNWDLAAQLGPYAQNPDRWENHSVINLVYLLHPKTQPLALIIDCGTEDFFYTVNMNLHHLLLERNIPHDFITRPGAHNWNYWSNSVRYQLLFFHRFFQHG
ncbi:alpha/beta hydrolase [Dinghuibacter silviterrae]|uniref:S-formylglutathione hydrolase FrmB n=1 Tax=Dinghuibacter silviterrae TaxID=1539049 RepID=A0A4R8DSE9_9BACT|nr:alpha/beta hydrolase family protein [Dinghuibacter silviterrae]TDX00307.1 S-formylglutathione hydrolase FrmB [Dinghuibacter silviterrae]